MDINTFLGSAMEIVPFLECDGSSMAIIPVIVAAMMKDKLPRWHPMSTKPKKPKHDDVATIGSFKYAEGGSVNGKRSKKRGVGVALRGHGRALR